jgi:integrase
MEQLRRPGLGGSPVLPIVPPGPDHRDPVTGRERRSWHPAGTDRAATERLAARLAEEEQGRADAVRALTFGAYLTGQWLPGKKLRLATTTYRGYERNVHNHLIPTLGRIGLRRLRHHHIEALYDRLLTPNTERPALSPKTVYEIHLVIRGALDDAVRRGLLTRNVALIARSPRLKAITKTEAQSWTAEQLQQFLRAAAGHQLFPLLWLAAMTGMRRNEVLGLKWDDIDFQRKTISLNRGLVAVGYELHQTRGKTRNARRPIDLDDTTLTVLAGWKALRAAEFAAVGVDSDGWVFTDGDGEPIHPHALSQTFERIAQRAGVPIIRLDDLRHTHGTLLIKEGIPVKVVSERLGHANIAFTIQTYQHVSPACRPTPPAPTSDSPHPFHRRRPSRWNVGGTAGRRPPEPGRTPDTSEGPGL